MPSTAGVNLAISGLASGFNWQSLVTQLAQAERAPETQWQATQAKLNSTNSAFTVLKSYLTQLQSVVQSLKDPNLYQNRSAASSSPSVASAASSANGTIGSFALNISQLATAASQTGTGNISSVISLDGNLNNVTVGTANFSTAVTAGTFTINGAQVTIATTDSLQTVFNNIAAATGNAVTASYNNTTDQITLTSSSPITLGSAADTSNFLQVAKLYNNNTGTITSSDRLGRVNTSATLNSADLRTAITDGGSGNGAFTINGVTINFNASTDSVQDVLNRINGSAAGVTAAYDTINNRFTLTNNTTGNVGISMQDVTGNFLAATGLSGGTFAAGKNLLYTINNGATLQSQSNTIDSSSSGITGLSVTALATGATTVTVGSDTSAIATDLQNFVTYYNDIQGYIDTNAATSTDSSGNVTPGTLTGDMAAADLTTSLRSAIFSPVSISGLSGTLSQLAGLGFTSNGYNNTITLDSSTLNTVLSGNLSDVQKLFSDPANGLAGQLNTFLTNTIGDSGTLTNHQTALTQQSNSINTQIANLEKQITADSNYWTTEFQNMETAQSQLNQQLSALNQQISNGTL